MTIMNMYLHLVRSSWIWIYKECGSHDLVNKWQYVSNMILYLVVHINFFCICFWFASNMERLAENIVQMGLNLGKSTRKADVYIACHIYIDTNYTNCSLEFYQKFNLIMKFFIYSIYSYNFGSFSMWSFHLLSWEVLPLSVPKGYSFDVFKFKKWCHF